MNSTTFILIAFLTTLSLVGIAALWVGRRWGRADGNTMLDQLLQSAQTRLALAEQSVEHQKKMNDAQAVDAANTQEELRQQIQSHKDEIIHLNQELANAKNKIVEMETITQKNKEIIAMERKQFDELRQQIQSHKDEISHLNQDLAIAKNKIVEMDTITQKNKEIIAMERRQFDELRQQIQSHKDENNYLNQELSNAKNRVVEMETTLKKNTEIIAMERKQFDELRQQIQLHKNEINTHVQELSKAKSKIVEMETVLEKNKEIITIERKQFEELRSKFNQEFENLANKIFESKHTVFDTQSREGLNTLLQPFKEQLESFRKRIDQVHTENVQGQTTLKSELDNLRQLNLQITQEASDLTKALKGDKKLQGTWGEQKVELLLEQAGLRKSIEYEREQNFKDDAGNNFRPDFVVKLPEGKHIIIDSKVSLVDYSSYVSAESADDRQRYLSAHVASIRNHIKTLSDKHYPELVNIDSPDFTFMFIAIEPAYLAAVEQTPSLFQEAYDARIALVTATTLLPVLRVVANLWSLQRQNESTQKLAEQASKIYDKLRIFIEKMDNLGNQLDRVQDTYRDSMNTLKDGRGSLVKTVEKFKSLGVKVIKELPISVQTKPYLEDGNMLFDESDDSDSSNFI